MGAALPAAVASTTSAPAWSTRSRRSSPVLRDPISPSAARSGREDGLGGLSAQARGRARLRAAGAHRYWDLSRYDGITLWARRGSDSQSGLLVALHDKHTSDALNRENQTFCRRIKTCRPSCQNGLPCTPENPDAPKPTHRCFDPAVGMAPIPEPAEIEEVYPVCGPSACRSPDYYYDRDLDGTECKPYEFSTARSGLLLLRQRAPARREQPLR